LIGLNGEESYKFYTVRRKDSYLIEYD